jgi:hypothetical protein
MSLTNIALGLVVHKVITRRQRGLQSYEDLAGTGGSAFMVAVMSGKFLLAFATRVFSKKLHECFHGIVPHFTQSEGSKKEQWKIFQALCDLALDVT